MTIEFDGWLDLETGAIWIMDRDTLAELGTGEQTRSPVRFWQCGDDDLEVLRIAARSEIVCSGTIPVSREDGRKVFDVRIEIPPPAFSEWKATAELPPETWARDLVFALGDVSEPG